jgi:hypothetical protein
VLSLVVLATLATAVDIAFAQTPAQMEYDRQQREYWRQQEQQRQEQQRQQQIMQDNARRQQEESRQLNAPSGQGTGSAGGGSTGGGQGRSTNQAAADNLSAARATWEKKPPLPPDHNPLLGKWTRPASPKGNSSDPFAGLMALAKGGLCEVLFGGGVFEFKTDRLMGMDARTAPQELDRVEYRGDSKHVVVIPKTTVKLMEFDVEGPDRINWKSQNCVLVRSGPASSSAGATGASSTNASSATPPSGASKVASSTATSTSAASSGGGVLELSVGAPSAGNKVAGRKLWVLREDAQVALIKGGITSTPYASVLQNWMRACSARSPDCEKGVLALKGYSVGIATTDANGHATTPSLPPGRYWVLSDAKVANKHVMWNQPVDVKSSVKSLTLDERNSMPVD